MDPKVWGKLLTLHRRGYDDVEALRDDGPLPAELRNRPKMGSRGYRSCGGGIRFLAPSPIVWGYVDIYRRKKYVGGASRGPRCRGAHPRGARPPPSWPHRGFLDGGSKSPGSYLMRKSRFRRFNSVWTPFDIPFLRNSEIGKKQQFWVGPPVNRLVPKII